MATSQTPPANAEDPISSDSKPEVPLALTEDGEFGLLIGDGEDALKIE